MYIHWNDIIYRNKDTIFYIYAMFAIIGFNIFSIKKNLILNTIKFLFKKLIISFQNEQIDFIKSNNKWTKIFESFIICILKYNILF